MHLFCSFPVNRLRQVVKQFDLILQYSCNQEQFAVMILFRFIHKKYNEHVNTFISIQNSVV